MNYLLQLGGIDVHDITELLTEVQILMELCR